MKILITGSSGFIGSGLASFLIHRGHQVFKLVRTKNVLKSDEIYWDPQRHEIDLPSLENFDGVIHLAGENLISGRWSDERKKIIKESRVEGTEFLVQNLTKLKNKPKILIAASAIGYYGDQGNSLLTEKASKGKGFLSDICQQWEEKTQKAVDIGIRVVNLRMGVVLDPSGGALKMILTPFKWGMGGKIGSGQQYMSWIALEDLYEAILFIIENNSLQGPINLVSPHPVTNEEFTKLLGDTLHRPTFFTVPTFALHGILGEAADEVLLASTRVIPEKLLQSHFTFQYPTLESYLHSVLQTA